MKDSELAKTIYNHYRDKLTDGRLYKFTGVIVYNGFVNKPEYSLIMPSIKEVIPCSEGSLEEIDVVLKNKLNPIDCFNEKSIYGPVRFETAKPDQFITPCDQNNNPLKTFTKKKYAFGRYVKTKNGIHWKESFIKPEKDFSIKLPVETSETLLLNQISLVVVK